jgi:hypothetical protein
VRCSLRCNHGRVGARRARQEGVEQPGRLVVRVRQQVPVKVERDRTRFGMGSSSE